MSFMHYYEVFVSEPGYQKQEPLTYAFDGVLAPGTVVQAPFGRKSVIGFVHTEVLPPKFKTKQLEKLDADYLLPEALGKLHAWLQTYYPSGSGLLTQAFIPPGLAKPTRRKATAKKPIKKLDLPLLTKQQQQAYDYMLSSGKRSFLLHGETGSGKTRLYIELALNSLKKGKSVLILTPEISLVPQLLEVFDATLDYPVTSLHSGLTKATRAKNWISVASSTEPMVVIGTRLALFAPISDLGLVVVDEMHEPAYKQESGAYYYGLRVAAQLAKLHAATIVYGSATPSVVEYFMAQQTDSPIVRMDKTARPTKEVARSLVDLKNKGLFSRHGQLSDELLQAIGDRIARKEQTLLFLNRRGTARQILCTTCGWQALCPSCDMPLIYHADSHQMRCHTCGYHSAPPYACPSCSSSDVVYRSLGTKALHDSLLTLFPEARIQRFDTDNTAAEKLDRHYEALKNGEIDILVGTQMLGKGLDLPKLSLVGIVNADTGLSTPDFSAAERSYQLLHQAIGRVGRGHVDGQVIVQTFNPKSPLLQAAVKQDWISFYEQEITERKQFDFPPYYFLLKLTITRKTLSAAESYSGKLYTQARQLGLRLKINEPTPSFYEKSYGKYNWQIVVRAKDRRELTKLVQQLTPGDWSYNLDPINLL